MSHFTVMVVGDVDHNLAPFHEFECTGLDDEFVQTISKVEELRESYASQTMHIGVCTDTQEVRELSDDMFFRDPTPEEITKAGPLGLRGTGFGHDISYVSKDWGDGLGHRPKVRYIPDGWEEREVPMSSQKTFKEYVEYWDSIDFVPHGEEPDLEGEHKYGYGTLDAEGNVVDVFRRTNPNKKWDWYVVGGRWSNFLTLKDGRKADSARKADIDFAHMRDAAGEDAMERWLLMQSARGEHLTWVPWEDMRKQYEGAAPVEHPDGLKHAIDQARDAYHAQPAVIAMKNFGRTRGFFESLDVYAAPLAEFVEQARDRAVATFAYCEDRKWAEKGEMGWWGISMNEMEQADWNKLLRERIDALPDDAVLTVVDCHI